MIVTGDPTPDRPAVEHQVRPGRGAAHPRRRARASSPCASTTPTWCAIRSSPRSSGPMTATPRGASASARAPTSAMPQRRGRGRQARPLAARRIDIDITVEAGDWPDEAALSRPGRPRRRRRSGRDRRQAGHRASSASSFPTTPISARSTRLARQGQADQRAVLPGFSDAPRRRPAADAGRHRACRRDGGARGRTGRQATRRPYHPSRGPWPAASSGPRSRDRRRGRGDGSSSSGALARLAIPDPYA